MKSVKQNQQQNLPVALMTATQSSLVLSTLTLQSPREPCVDHLVCDTRISEMHTTASSSTVTKITGGNKNFRINMNVKESLPLATVCVGNWLLQAPRSVSFQQSRAAFITFCEKKFYLSALTWYLACVRPFTIYYKPTSSFYVILLHRICQSTVMWYFVVKLNALLSALDSVHMTLILATSDY